MQACHICRFCEGMKAKGGHAPSGNKPLQVCMITADVHVQCAPLGINLQIFFFLKPGFPTTAMEKGLQLLKNVMKSTTSCWRKGSGQLARRVVHCPSDHKSSDCPLDTSASSPNTPGKLDARHGPKSPDRVLCEQAIQ